MAEMAELCAPICVASEEQRFIMADPVDLNVGAFEIAIKTPNLVVRTYEYRPAGDARFVLHLLSGKE
jgi:hypothetical protein